MSEKEVVTSEILAAIVFHKTWNDPKPYGYWNRQVHGIMLRMAEELNSFDPENRLLADQIFKTLNPDGELARL
jgi:hypothetical protein